MKIPLFLLSLLFAFNGFAGGMASPNASVESDGAFRGTVFCQGPAGGPAAGAARVHRDSFRPSAPRGAETAFCKGSTPVKALKSSFVSYEPKFAPGIAIDDAVDFKNGLRAAYRELAKGYFAATSRQFVIEQCQPYGFDPDQEASFYGLAAKNPKELDADEWVRSYQATREDLGAARGDPQLLWVTLKGKEIAAAVPGGLFQKVFFSAHATEPQLLVPLQTAKLESSGLFAMRKKQRLWSLRGKEEKKAVVYPLEAACVGDACALRAGYIFKDLPESFRKELGLRPEVGRDEASKKWSIRAALRDAEEIWDAYMRKFTSVKEAQMPEEKLTRYDVELDLEPYCQYALPRKDMVAQ